MTDKAAFVISRALHRAQLSQIQHHGLKILHEESHRLFLFVDGMHIASGARCQKPVQNSLSVNILQLLFTILQLTQYSCQRAR